MTAYRVDIERLRAGAASSEISAARLRRLASGEPLRHLADGLPGTRSALLLAELTRRWTRQLALAGATLEGHAVVLTGAADRYAASEDEARAAFESAYPWLPGADRPGGSAWTR